MDGFVLAKTISNVVELAEREVKFFQLQLLDKGLEIKLMAPPKVLVNVDEEMIRIGFRNLISNAIKFARNGTPILIKINKNDQNKVVISVTNYGEPLPPEIVDKLFTYQMTSTVDSKGEKGTGLGLAMTAFFVRLNGGEIYLGPSEEGTITFCIEIPEATQQPAQV
jgi:signal transduction histidine kinase